MAHVERLVETLCTAQIRKTARIFALQAEHIAAREERACDHLVVARLGCHARGLFVVRECLGIVAERFAHFALADEHAGPQTRTVAAGQQCPDRRNFGIECLLIAL